jgi:lipase
MSNLGGIEHRLQTCFGEVCWFEWNKAEEGPVLLLLHATGFHARVWDQVIAHLPHDLHVVAADHLGHGRSFKPDSLADWAEGSLAMLPLVDRFKGRPIIGCGHSMGGYVLSRLAAERPDAFKKILLIDPVILARDYYTGPSTPIADPSDHPVSRRRAVWDSIEQMQGHFGQRPPYSKWNAAVLADYCQHGLLPAEGGDGFVLACPPRLEASIYQNAQRTSPYDWLNRIEAECTILRAPTAERGGEMDFSNSPTWLGLGAEMGAVQDLLWAENSHFIPMEAPEKVAELLTVLVKG